jgi:hypothetical protein
VERTRRGFSLWHVVATLPWIVAVLVARSRIGDNSFLWHVTAGKVQNSSGSVLTVDPFSFSLKGEAWRTQSWLADIGYAWVDDRVGLDFVPWLRYASALALFVVVAAVVWRVSFSIAAAASVSFLTALLAVPYLNPRPVLFSYVLLALVVLVEERAKLRWTLPVVFYVWAAIHGSWVIGAGYLALSVLKRGEYRRIRTEAPWIAFVTLLTAHGWGVVEYLLAFHSNSQALSLITEWAPPDLMSIPKLPFTVGLLLLLVGAANGGLKGRDVGFAIPIILLGLTSSRSVLPAFLMLTPTIGVALATLLAGRFGRPLVGVRVIVVAILALPLLLPVSGGLDANRFPVELVDRIDGRRAFHDDVVGGYMIYSSWPTTEVLVDDRAELYGESLGRFVDIRAGRADWEPYFDAFGIDVAILRRDEALDRILRLNGWVEVAADGDDDQWVLLEEGRR